MKILVVDDEQDICEILQYNLETEGYEVVTANSAEEALATNGTQERSTVNVEVLGDASLIYSIFRNLIDNAISYATGASRLDIVCIWSAFFRFQRPFLS